jgi:FkbM family methyltransferase
VTWHGQAEQDAWVIEQHGAKPGFFIDVGAYDGVEHSNTLTLERNYGWHGICIEPQLDAFTRCQTVRSATSVMAAVSDRIGSCRLVGDRVVMDLTGDIPMYTLAHLLDVLDAPPIDYLSIDAEGMDLTVLQGHDFEQWPVHLITVETNVYLEGPERKNAIFAFLTAHGFKRRVEGVIAPGYGEFEDWYVYE